MNEFENKPLPPSKINREPRVVLGFDDEEVVYEYLRDDLDLVVVRVLGDWTRDVSSSIRQRAVDELSKHAITILDLRHIGFMDTWGVETLCNAIQQNDGTLLCWVGFASRRADYKPFLFASLYRGMNVPQLEQLDF